MWREIFKELGVFGKLFLLFVLVVVFSIFGLGVSLFLFNQPADIQSQKIIQLINSVFIFLIPALVGGFLWYKKPFQTYSLHKLPSFKISFLSFLLVISIIPFINFLSFINEQMVLPEFLKGLEQRFMEAEEKIKIITEQMLKVESFSGFLLNLLVMAITPAIVEEVFFRGALLTIFSEKKNRILAIWLVAIVFSLIHFQMYGFLPRMIYGAILGYLAVWSGSLWLPIFVHFLQNGSVVIFSYLKSNTNNAIEQMENFGKSETYVFGIISGVISVFLLWIIYRQSKKTSLR
jgi:membrane protease YdiL (CAAX protease family)